MKSRQQATAERPPAKRRGPKPSISDEALLVAIEADLEASPWEGEGHRKVWARLRVCRGIRVSRKRGLRVMRENNLLSPHRCRRRGGNLTGSVRKAMSVRSSPMPPTSCGARTAFGCSRWTTAGAGYSPPSSIGTPSASAGMCASEATASPPFSRSPWGLRGCMPRPPPVRRGGWPCGWITAPSICRTTSPTRSSSGASAAVLRLRRTAPDQRRRREVQSHAQGTDHPWPHLPQHRGAAERRPRVRRTVQCPVDRGEERLPEPRSSSSGVAHRDVTQARRMRQRHLCPRNRVRYKTSYDEELGRHCYIFQRFADCQWRSKKGPPRRCKKGPLGGCGLVPVVHGRAPRATRRALNRLTRRRAREGPVGPRGQAWAGWSVQLAVGV